MFRKQSLHLFISSAVNFVIMAFLIYNDYHDNFMDICRGVTAGSGNLLLFSIFLHKKKNLQIKIIRVFSILYFMFGCCIIFFIDVEHSSFIVFGIFSACIFSYLATKYIKKDIELISSSNRIR
ncbi:MAG: DUF4293 family protein [Bacteroidota bacterium]|nr:DUF4293 family protein [Bacteroidota bacterium]